MTPILVEFRVTMVMESTFLSLDMGTRPNRPFSYKTSIAWKGVLLPERSPAWHMALGIPRSTWMNAMRDYVVTCEEPR